LALKLSISNDIKRAKHDIDHRQYIVIIKTYFKTISEIKSLKTCHLFYEIYEDVKERFFRHDLIIKTFNLSSLFGSSTDTKRPTVQLLDQSL